MLILSCGVSAEDLSTSKQSTTLVSSQGSASDESVIILPSPDHSVSATLDAVLSERRSVRDYQDTPITKQELSNLLWAAQGITDSQKGKRTAPSGQMIYPITLHVALSSGVDILPGVYAYHASEHQLIKEMDETGKQGVIDILAQKSVKSAPACLVMSGNYTPYQKFGTDMANQSMYLEGGHIAQNFLLELSDLNLAGVPFSGFNPEDVGKALGLDSDHPVIYAIAFGTAV